MAQLSTAAGSGASETTFVCCVERGRLEAECLLLVESIRRLDGPTAAAPIVAVSPRRGRNPRPETTTRLRALDVDVVEAPLNQRHEDYALANKAYAAAFVEGRADTETVTFVDSDSVFVQEPRQLTNDGSGVNPNQVSLRPVDLKGIGTDGEDDNSAYWDRVAVLAGGGAARSTNRVRTTVDKQRIVPYFNSGLVSVARTAGLMHTWRWLLAATLEKGLAPTEPHYVEQSTLAVAIASLQLQPRHLPPTYNYPIHLHSSLETEERIGCIDDAVHIHYHDIFRKYDDGSPFSAVGLDSAPPAWLDAGLRRSGLYLP